MPGTPNMLAPLGLSAYLPTVFDIDEDGLPEEVALIVYSDLNQYFEARSNSLRRRVYSHSHAGVFDLEKSKGQFPGPYQEPSSISLPGGRNRDAWYLFDNRVDWQHGSTHVIFMDNQDNPQISVSDALQAKSAQQIHGLMKAGCDQAIFVAAPNYGVVWLHHPARRELIELSKNLIPPSCRERRSMSAGLFRMITMEETIEISGPISLNFRFLRDEKYFI